MVKCGGAPIFLEAISWEEKVLEAIKVSGGAE